jgi:beta-N-acetylhexosaminidase
MASRTSLDLRSQVGQLLIFGFDGLEVSGKLRSTLATLQPGGIILFARNIETPQQTWSLLRESRTLARTPMFTCVDMEGGTVDRLKNVIAAAPPVEEVAVSGVRRLFREHGRLIGNECRALGFNVDFAPVVDLGFEASRSVLTSRTVSADPAATIVYAREFLKGLADAKMLGCGKHFPGLGEANLDTHHKLPEIKKPWKQLWEQDLLPYRELRRELPFVMVAHAAFPAVTKDSTPASVSKKWITDILRTKIGYKGLVVSDDLEMGGVQAAMPVDQAAVECIRAGADIFLVCHNDEHVWRTYNAVLAEAERDKRFRKQVEQAAKRVLAYKKKWGVSNRTVAAPDEKVINRLRQQSWMLWEEIRLAEHRAVLGE